MGNPFPLKQNAGKSFQGSIVLGKGFVLPPEEAERLIAKDPRNKDVLFPYLNGDDLNNDPEQKPSRWVINFFDWTEEKARTYHDCFEIVERLVKPERLIQKDRGGQEKWWQFLRPRKELYGTISKLDQVMVIAKTAKYIGVLFSNTKVVLDQSLTIGIYDNFLSFSLMQSSICDSFAKAYGTTMETRFRFNVDILETFPFPLELSKDQKQQLEVIGLTYYNFRQQLMQATKLGITKIYNIFHTQKIKSDVSVSILQGLDKKTIEKLYCREIWHLWSHLQSESCIYSLDQATRDIDKLRQLQIEMDHAVMNAYNWDDIKLKHDFYEVDYLPEDDNVRFTIDPLARKEILKRLLALNHNLYRIYGQVSQNVYISAEQTDTQSKVSNLLL